ncbi:MAG: transcriptional repressor NrdR [Armatimonadetes bacterium]|nr:transcriptional repressor NrdR [Armatimonadota bacterium]
MKCPFCGSLEDKVVDSREIREGNATKRRRQCLACGRRFTTYEEIDELRLMVVKRDGRREGFDRGKILRSLRVACQKRNVDMSVLERLTDEIEREIVDRRGNEVSSTEIGERVMARLRELDHVAYVRFASVYRQFRDVTQFKDLVEVLDREKEAGSKETPRLPYG